jgi:hypothetical protein
MDGRMRWASLAFLGLVASASGCGSAVDPVSSARGELGRVLVELREPTDPVRGMVPVEVRILDAKSGEPADGLAVTVVAIMPAHAHGSSSAAPLSGEGGGSYASPGVPMTMAGHWELHLTVEGPIEDRATLPFDVR